jgi:hypothetical protein
MAILFCRETSEDITGRLFLVNIKGLKVHGTGKRNKIMQEANMKIF